MNKPLREATLINRGGEASSGFAGRGGRGEWLYVKSEQP